MSDTPTILDSIQIKEPCSASWEKMSGDERARHCRACSLTVFNISNMTREEAETLVREKEGRLCARFYRRADGTILTADCGKVIKQRKRRRAAMIVVATVSLAAAALGASGSRDEVDYDDGSGRSPVVEKLISPLRGMPLIGNFVNRMFPMPMATMGAICVLAPPTAPVTNAAPAPVGTDAPGATADTMASAESQPGS